ncbi:TPA: adhesin [Enterobacter asburiae]|nr:adhesin [Enterobacter asburiae]
MSDSSLKTIAGYKVLPIAPGVGIAPRARLESTYVVGEGPYITEYINGSIGLPETRGTVIPGGQIITNPVNGRSWCMPPRMSNVTKFYAVGFPNQTTMRGTWVIVADGTQTSQDIQVGTFWGRAGNGSSYNISQNVFPSAGIQLRISTLECMVNTPAQINFGAVASNLRSGAELGVQTNVLAVNCSQDSSRGVDANINVQFRALTDLYEGAPTRLALSQGGGYITGEIDRGVTGSGNCTGISGLSFDSTPLKLGSITSAQSTQNTTNLVTWRLCSGGSKLPSGNVSAAAEMLVTFN